MTTVQDQAAGITRDVTFKYATICGNDTADIMSFDQKDGSLWKQAIDEMLRWKGSDDLFEPEDRPTAEILDTAIDYAMDQIKEGGPVPASIIPSGSGRVAMEWNDKLVTIVVEFTGLGIATYARFEHGRLVARSTLRRNPQSRKMELRG